MALIGAFRSYRKRLSRKYSTYVFLELRSAARNDEPPYSDQMCADPSMRLWFARTES